MGTFPLVLLFLLLGVDLLQGADIDPTKRIYFEDGFPMYDGKPIGPIADEQPFAGGRAMRNMSDVLASKYYTSFELMNKDEKLINGTFRRINGTLVNMNATFDFLNDTHVNVGGKVWPLKTIFPKLPQVMAKDFNSNVTTGNRTQFGARCVLVQWPIVKVKTYHSPSDCNCQCCKHQFEEHKPWTYRPPCPDRKPPRPPLPTRKPYYTTTKSIKKRSTYKRITRPTKYPWPDEPTKTTPEEPTENPEEDPTDPPEKTTKNTPEEPTENPEEDPTDPPEKTTKNTPEEPTENPEENPTDPPEKTTKNTPEEPNENPEEETTKKPTRKPTKTTPEEPTENPEEEATEKPTRKPTKTTPEEPTENPEEERTEKTTRKPTKTTPEEPTENPEEETTENPTRKPTKTTPEEPTENPEEETTEKPTRKPNKTTPEEPTENPEEETTEKPTRKPTKTTLEEPTENPEEETTEKPTRKPNKTTLEETTENPKEETTEKPTRKPTKTTPEEPTENPEEESTENTTKKPTRNTPEEPTENPEEESTENPPEKRTDKPIEKPITPMYKNHSYIIITPRYPKPQILCAVYEKIVSPKKCILESRRENILTAFLHFYSKIRPENWEAFQKFYTNPGAIAPVAEMALKNALLKQVSQSTDLCGGVGCCELKKLGRNVVLRVFIKWVNSMEFKRFGEKDIFHDFFRFVKLQKKVKDSSTADIQSLKKEVKVSWTCGMSDSEFKKIKIKCTRLFPTK